LKNTRNQSISISVQLSKLLNFLGDEIMIFIGKLETTCLCVSDTLFCISSTSKRNGNSRMLNRPPKHNLSYGSLICFCNRSELFYKCVDSRNAFIRKERILSTMMSFSKYLPCFHFSSKASALHRTIS